MLVTVGGLGLLPKAPGTWASIPAALLFFALLALQVERATYVIVSVSVAIAASVLCVLLTPFSAQRFGTHDPSSMVLDEVAGMAVAALVLPMIAHANVRAAALFMVCAFVLFRLFDIFKPGFVGASQNLPSGWGVLADDVLAGAATLGLLWVGWSVVR